MASDKLIASEKIRNYFNSIDSELKKAYGHAGRARLLGYDPEKIVDIHLAKNMAQRVEGLIGSLIPQIKGSGVSERIQELEEKYGASAWEVALILSEEVANEKFCTFKDKKEAIEAGIRVGFAYQTMGIVSAPLEGFLEIKIKKRKDGNDYLAMVYAGPVRGAGGTAAAFSLILGDYLRKKTGYGSYDADNSETNRYITELDNYHERVTNLQYKPSSEELEFLVKNLPVEIDGDPTEELEVSNYKDLPRVGTNRIRGGVCLVLSMLALKAPKLWKEVSKLKNFDIGWGFLKEFIEIQKKKKAKKDVLDKKQINPDYTYISDLVAGRPVLSYPLRVGGFRLRYGRTRISGYSAAGINPITMHVLDKYIAIGTQLKIERPGKAAALTPCDTIDPPIVKLHNGSVIRLESEAQAKQIINEIREILFLGDILISYGDFYDRAHPLVPAGYCEEWYIQELEKAAKEATGEIDLEKLSEQTSVEKDILERVFQEPLTTNISAEDAIKLSDALKIPLHPKYTYFWGTIGIEALELLVDWFQQISIKKDEEGKIKLILPYSKNKRILELLGIPHIVVTNEFVVLEGDDALAIATIFALELNPVSTIKKIIEQNRDKKTLEIINMISPIKIRDKAGTFIGARMGRPEKAKMRRMTGKPHVLFSIGKEGGRLRSFQSALEEKKITAEFPLFYCEHCQTRTIYAVCERCHHKTAQKYYCSKCGVMDSSFCRHGEAQTYLKQEIDTLHYFEKALNYIGELNFPDLIKGVRETSNKTHISENLAKGILRAKHDIYVNKDGTTRYDMTELPLTHFKPKEIRTSIQKLTEMGYTQDIYGNQLENQEQTLELFPQDIILPSNSELTEESADSVLFRVANFVDDLLVKFYRLEPYYELKDKSDLEGHLVIALAPHISAGIIGRIIGFSNTQVIYAHPLLHAAIRRDADGDEACVMLLMDALLNFSRQYLPDSRGSRTMDSPLVLTSIINPAEVDDMVHRMDIGWRYPIELYEGALELKYPWEINVDLFGKRLDTELQYEGIGFTHSTSNINQGVTCSAYKTLATMEEKLKGQMILAEKIRAVDVSDVARLVVEKHFLKDIKGNLRKFSTQEFRCVKCNKKYRRPPLRGVCLECNGKLIFTISEGSIVKYLEPAISIAAKYNVSPYLKQTLEITKHRVEELFGREAEKQEALGKWFG